MFPGATPREAARQNLTELADTATHPGWLRISTSAVTASVQHSAREESAMAAAATPGPATAGSEAMAALWRAHGSALIQFALKLTLGDWYRAEDIVQETLLRAWYHPEIVGTGHIAVRPWL